MSSKKKLVDIVVEGIYDFDCGKFALVSQELLPMVAAGSILGIARNEFGNLLTTFGIVDALYVVIFARKRNGLKWPGRRVQQVKSEIQITSIYEKISNDMNLATNEKETNYDA